MNIKLTLLVPLLLGNIAIGHAAENNDILYATVNDETRITKADLRNYAINNPYLMPMLSIPGGPMKVLDDMIKIDILVREGRRIGQPELGELAGGISGYAISVKNRLAPRCKEPDETTTRQYYDNHPELFSTPLFLRLNRYGLKIDESNRAEVEKKLQRLLAQLNARETSFADLTASNEDEHAKARNGDIGFVADNDPANPVMGVLRNAPKGKIVGPLQQGNMLFIYQIIDKRDPILGDYGSMRNEVAVTQQDECSRTRTDALFKELKERWKVKVLVTDISVKPGEE